MRASFRIPLFFAAFALATVLLASTLVLRARAAKAPCAWAGIQYSAQRDPANPLMLSQPPGANPLNGARFFVDGPAHGMAAGAIARLLGMNPKRLPDGLSWSFFDSVIVPRALLLHPRVAHKVHMLEKIASQPEPQRFSIYSAGGGPGAVFGQVYKVLCHNMTADPGTIPILQSMFIYPHGKYCASRKEIAGNLRTFRRQVNEMARGIGRKPAVILMELDSGATSSCVGSRRLWKAALRYEINVFSALPHAVVYTEAGYSDANRARYTWKLMNAIGIGKIRGFYTNDTHEQWTINEIRWAEKIVRHTGAHFIVNTAQNGQGPLLNKHPGKHGVEYLCNPPGRGLGPTLNTNTGFRNMDAFMWTHTPGRSSGTCNGGPPSGVFWPKRAIREAQLANEKLGPAFPSRPY
jgi:Glycosyl hydrolases family 6